VEDSKMPLTEHLSELRKRLFISLSVLFVIFIVLFNYSEDIFTLLTFPLNSELRLTLTNPYVQLIHKEAPPLVFFAVAEAFWMHLKISFVAAIVVALPLLFHQLWLFIAPGLLPKEKKMVLPFVVSATLLFLLGAAFCFLVVLPFAITFLLGYKTSHFTAMLSIEKYIDFCLKFILAFGAVFELPLAIFFLARFNIVTPATLAKNRKFAVLFAFVVAAVLTPTPDAFNQTLMAVPIIFLYEIGILVARVVLRKRENA
jgi:sec-independent protein translocase protein TatC